MFLRRRLLAVATALVVAGAGTACVAAVEPWQVAVGYDRLVNALGGSVPNGAGVPISIVEAGSVYFPDPAFPEFAAASDPLGQAIQFIDGSGTAGTTFSAHATFNVGQYIFGNTVGLAQAANQVTVYQADHWLTNQLRYNTNQEPIAQPFKVQNHSWVGTFGSSSSDQSALRRLDYLIETGEMTAVVGSNNNGAADLNVGHPNLLAHSYNAIVAGRTDSRHSRGVTNSVYGPGRFRPDIVSSFNLTSTTTAQVSSAATLLRGVVTGTDADRSETIKTMLMAGATKEEFNGFDDPGTLAVDPRNWTHSATQPLDAIFGAGELNVFNSYLMTVGGQHAGSTSEPAAAVTSHGWDYQNRKADPTVGDIYYNFVVPDGSTAQELSIMLAWNVKITDTSPGSNFTPTESLQNLDLALYDSTTAFLGTVLDQSISTVDNVEHIYQTNLGPGTYTLKVTGAANWDYGLAWRTSTLFDEPNADFDGDGFVAGSDFLVWQRNLGKLVGALQTEGDADGDGDVDGEDLVLYQARAMPAPPMVAFALAPVPEPAALVTAAAAVGFLALALRGARRRSGV